MPIAASIQPGNLALATATSKTHCRPNQFKWGFLVAFFHGLCSVGNCLAAVVRSWNTYFVGWRVEAQFRLNSKGSIRARSPNFLKDRVFYCHPNSSWVQGPRKLEGQCIYPRQTMAAKKASEVSPLNSETRGLFNKLITNGTRGA